MKPLERREARRLRREDGMSVKEIARKLDVSKSSVSLWVRDIELSNAQLAALDYRHHNHANQRNGSRAVAEKYRALRRKYQEEGRMKARERDPLHVAGCMLYWGEGAKTRNGLELANSDPDLIQFYVKFLLESLCIPSEELCVRIYCYTNNGLSVNEIENYWLNILKLPQQCLKKTITNLRPRSSEERGRILKYGVCRVIHRVHSLHHVLGAIQEYTGIDKPEWML
jgi:transposase-like protein